MPRARDLRLAFDSAPPASAGRDLALADVVVEECHDGLVASTRDGGLRLPGRPLLGDLLSVSVTEAFKDLAARCSSRVSWASRRRAMKTQHFVGARRWAADVGLPRFVFVRVPGELKPFFVDLDSLTYVNVPAGRLRRAAGSPEPVVVSEMLPGPDELWLPDAAGRRYGAELRVVAVDRT